jgi:site-specific recombinase XerD
MDELATADRLRKYLMANRTDRVTRSRVNKFLAWQGDVFTPDLAGWRDHLLAEGLSGSTVASYLSTIRRGYRRVLNSQECKAAATGYAQSKGYVSPEEQRAFVDRLMVKMQLDILPENASVKVIRQPPRPDAGIIRMTRSMANKLIAAPGVDDLKGMRDTALIALLFCTGIREGELVHLEVQDLRHYLNGNLALLVRERKGRRSRLIPYGKLDWCLSIVDLWLDAAGITEGPVFRAVRKGSGSVSQKGLTVRSVELIVSSYPITVEGELVRVKPHDCRKTYAQLQYDAGMELVAIHQNLGHGDISTTLGYIGQLDAHKRAAKSVYRFALGKVDKARSALQERGA